MNPFKSLESTRGLSGLAMVAALMAATSAPAAETYQYYRFEPLHIWANNTQIQLSEFTFSLNGQILNTNNRNQSGIDAIPVAVTSGTQDVNGGEGPPKVADGDNGTKWFRNDALGEANALTFAFNAPVTIDAYSWRSANDSVGFNRNPDSWKFSGSTDGVTWVLLDGRWEYPINNANDTDQDTFTIPEEVVPAITKFNLYNTEFEGTSGIVLNGGDVSFEWDSQFADGATLLPGTTGDLGPSGFETITPPANATTPITLTASQTGVAGTDSESILIRSVAGGSATHRYVRFKATKMRTGQAGGWIQLSEFGFTNDDLPVDIAAVENPGGNTPEAEGVGNLIDGNGTDNKWLDFANAPVIFDFGSSKTIDSYHFFTGNDADDRDPIQWTLEGSDDLISWSLIENVDFDYPTPLDRNRDSRSIPLPGASISPLVRTFVGSAVTAIQGEPFALTWDVLGSTTVTIDQGVGSVAAAGSQLLAPPLGETTYTLTASGGLTSVTRTFTVEVIAPPATNTINYADFNAAGEEFSTLGSTFFSDGVLRLTEDNQGQRGEAWFRYKQQVSNGFEATFKMSMNQDAPNGAVPADGLAFVIQNNAAGTNTASLGEAGVAENALNIKFKSFGFDGTDASQIQILEGTQVLATSAAYNTPGIVLTGIPDDPAVEGNQAVPYTFGTKAGAAPYQVRIVYVPGTPGHIDVYFEGIAVLQNVEVDLAASGAVDASGKAYLGFTARTGANVQNNDIIDWEMAYGDFSALPPFGLVKSVAHTVGGARVIDLVWNAEETGLYNVTRSTGLNNDWQVDSEQPGVAGQIGVRINLDAVETTPREFFRVEEVE